MRFRLLAVIACLAILHPTPASGAERSPGASRGLVAVSPALDAPLRAISLWNATVAWNAVGDWNRAMARQAASKRAQTKPPAAPARSYGDKWSRVAQCESGMTNASTGNGFYGYFQFTAQTWHGIGESGLPTDYDYAHQLAAAQRLQVRSGWGPWPVCGSR